MRFATKLTHSNRLSCRWQTNFLRWSRWRLTSASLQTKTPKCWCRICWKMSWMKSARSRRPKTEQWPKSWKMWKMRNRIRQKEPISCQNISTTKLLKLARKLQNRSKIWRCFAPNWPSNSKSIWLIMKRWKRTCISALRSLRATCPCTDPNSTNLWRLLRREHSPSSKNSRMLSHRQSSQTSPHLMTVLTNSLNL